MRGQLQRGEELAHGIRRVARKQIELLAPRRTRPVSSAPSANLHGQRKAIKHLRALLRLIRRPLGKKTHQKQRRALRRMARYLSPARDAFVQWQTVQKLLPALRHALGAPAAARLAAHLHSQVRLPHPPPHFLPTTFLSEEMKPRDFAHHDLRRALRRSWRRYRKQYQKVRQEPETAALHEWRKRTKELFLQLHFLESVCPRPVKKLTSRLEKLSKVLGDDHDLALLENNVRSLAPGSEATLLRVTQPLRARKQNAAFRLAEKLHRKHRCLLNF